MRVVIETPRGSFTKYRLAGEVFARDMRTPFPTLFNYGSVEGEYAGDGMRRDAIVLGPRLDQGSIVECSNVGRVLFSDAGVEDDKIVGSTRGEIRLGDKIRIHVFFTTYMVFKTLRYFIVERRVSFSFYRGLETGLVQEHSVTHTPPST
ncbi:MAG: inorganic diphosphatase [Candidatus Altiarchaeota archaeon]